MSVPKCQGYHKPIRIYRTNKTPEQIQKNIQNGGDAGSDSFWMCKICGESINESGLDSGQAAEVDKFVTRIGNKSQEEKFLEAIENKDIRYIINHVLDVINNAYLHGKGFPSHIPPQLKPINSTDENLK